MVQKKPCWMADDPMKGNFTFGMICNLFDFFAPLRRLQSRMVFFIPCGCIRQRAH